MSDPAAPSAPPGPLAGILVADFSRVLAGPYATMLLADLGADVVKVESPEGDETRHWVPTDPHGTATYFLGVNRGKRSIVLDLRDPGDRDLGVALADRADVLVQNLRPGAMARFGLDHATLRARNPALVYASITGFGSAGGADLAGYDLLAQAMSGLIDLTGPADGPGHRTGVSVVDVMMGLHAAVGILAALHRRAADGLGDHLEVDLLSSALSGMANHASALLAGGQLPRRMGDDHPSLAPYAPMPTADGRVVVIAATDRQFGVLCAAVGLPDLATDPRFATNADRVAHRDALDAALHAVLTTRPTAHWVAVLRGAGLPAGPVATIAEGLDDAAALGLDPVVRTGPAGTPSVRNPIRLDRHPAGYDLPPPALDEHGAAIRAWLRASPGG